MADRQTQQVVTVTIRLSEVQVGMLLFFAGRCAMPCGNSGTTDALVNRALLARDVKSARYRLTELGRQAVAQLEPGLVTAFDGRRRAS
jgi:hypothetical protein